ncbi:MAG: nuclear transport factor 2 family protein, partial [Thermoleophilaceae bacterium]|nr:nuclear transport factor 2 family protein [Thermoleophilaceae bacterium]
MSQENVEIVRQVYEAVARGDSAAVLALYDEEVELDATRLPETRLIGSGLARGHEGMRRFHQDWDEAWERAQDECEELIDADEHVISVVARRGLGRASGLRVNAQRAGVWTIRDGKVVRVVW